MSGNCLLRGGVPKLLYRKTRTADEVSAESTLLFEYLRWRLLVAHGLSQQQVYVTNAAHMKWQGEQGEHGEADEGDRRPPPLSPRPSPLPPPLPHPAPLLLLLILFLLLLLLLVFFLLLPLILLILLLLILLSYAYARCRLVDQHPFPPPSSPANFITHLRLTSLLPPTPSDQLPSPHAARLINTPSEVTAPLTTTPHPTPLITMHIPCIETCVDLRRTAMVLAVACASGLAVACASGLAVACASGLELAYVDAMLLGACW